jgi:probable HAF family extracellular repeat protein
MHTLTAAELKIIMPPPPRPMSAAMKQMIKSAASLTAGASPLAQQSGSAQPMDQMQSSPPTYAVIDLGLLSSSQSSSSYSQATGVNNAGQVTGFSNFTNNSGYTHAFVYSNGSMRDIGTLGSNQIAGGLSEAYAINDNGQVVGVAQGGATLDPFLYSNGLMQDIGNLGSTYNGYAGQAYGINLQGQVVGYSYYPFSGQYQHAFLYSSGVMKDLGDLGGGYSTAYGINSGGQVVGSSYTNSHIIHAFLYSNGTMKDIGTLGGDYSIAYGINDAGQIVGSSDSIVGGQTYAFVYANGSMQNIGNLGGTYAIAYGINDDGKVVGSGSINNGAAHAFLYSNGSMYDLNSLLFNPSAGWTLQQANGINDAGQIVGYGINPAGKTRAFLLNPLPEGSVSAASTVQTSLPTYGSLPAPQEGKGLVFITHGWIYQPQESIYIPEATNLVESTSNAVVQYLANNGITDWQVCGYMWINGADTKFPWTALANAEGQGKMIGDQIVQGGWTHVHFIAHSAGAGMIQKATEEIRATSQIPVTIHCTFLDAYDGVLGEKANEYGTGADWADSYFVRDIQQMAGLTGTILPNAYNVDVTALDPNGYRLPWYEFPLLPFALACDELQSDHGWPNIFYSNSITGNLSILNGSYYDGFGFPLSEEAGNWEFAMNQYPVGNGLSYGSVKQLGPDDGCVLPYINPPLHISGAPPFGLVATIKSTTGTVQTSPGSAQVGTGSPVWLSTVITDTNALNYVSFDAQFTSAAGADGLLTVYWDADMIGEVDEAAVQPGIQHYNFAFPNTAPSTSHVLGFHVDPFTSTHSALVLTNIVTGAAGVSQPPTLAVSTNTSNGLLVYKLSGQPGYYSVQSSGDFVNWTNIAILANTNGTVEFVDANSTNYPSRFYRAAVPTDLTQ